MTREDMKHAGIYTNADGNKFAVKRGNQWVGFFWDGEQYVVPYEIQWADRGVRYTTRSLSHAADYARPHGSSVHKTLKAAVA